MRRTRHVLIFLELCALNCLQISSTYVKDLSLKWLLSFYYLLLALVLTIGVITS